MEPAATQGDAARGQRGSHWIARRGDARLLVREWIEGADGRVFSSVGEWYWAALLRRSRAPWVAYTHSRPL